MVAPLAVTAALTSVVVLTSTQGDRVQAEPVATSAQYTAGHEATIDTSRSQDRASKAPVASVQPTTPAPSPVPSPSAAPSMSAAAASSAAPTPTVDWSELGSEGQTQWTKASVNVRSGPGTGFEVISSRASGSKVYTTSRTHDGWQQVSLDGTAGWIKSSFLTGEEPEAPQESTQGNASTSASSSSNSQSNEAVAATGECPRAGNASSGLTSTAREVLNAVCLKFPNVSSYGGYRNDGGSFHSSGRAVDIMISGEAGWEIARWLRSNASQLGVIEVIYEQKIWTTQRGSEGWRSMSDRGSASANHFDHVHVSVR